MCGQSYCACPPLGLAATRLWPCAGLPAPRGSLSPALQNIVVLGAGMHSQVCISKGLWPLRGHQRKSPEQVRALPQLSQHSCFVSTMGKNMGRFWKTFANLHGCSLTGGAGVCHPLENVPVVHPWGFEPTWCKPTAVLTRRAISAERRPRDVATTLNARVSVLFAPSVIPASLNRKSF